jgi:hypothetical protein
MSRVVNWVHSHRILTTALVCALGVWSAWHLFTDAAPYALDAEHVTICRLGRRPLVFGAQDDPSLLHGYPVRETIQAPSGPVRRKIAALLHAQSTYSRVPISYMCFEPGMAVRFGEGKNQVDVLICTDCDHAYFYDGDQAATLELSAIGSWRLESFYHQVFGWPAAEPPATPPSTVPSGGESVP